MKNDSSGASIVITGKKRGGPRQLADYLMNMGENEYVRVCEIGCFVAKTIPDALSEMWAVADGCKAKDFLYHVTFNPRPGVTLSDKQWKESVDTLEKNLGLVGHQRVVVEHTKKGRIHCHVAWNRVDPQTGLVKKLSFDRRKLRATALELGDKFGLMPTQNKGQSYKRGEIERGKRTGIDPKIVKAEITALWNRAKSGKGFIDELTRHGYILAKGDKDQFVLIDRAGSIHGLTRRIDGATAKTVKRGLADIDLKTLPTITEAKARVQTQLPKTSAKRKASTKGKSGKAAHTYIRRVVGAGRKGNPTTGRKYTSATGRHGTPPHKSWRPYGFFVTMRHAASATKKGMMPSAVRKNQATTSTVKPHTTKSPTATNRSSDVHSAEAPQGKTKQTSGGKTPTKSPGHQTDAGITGHNHAAPTVGRAAVPVPAPVKSPMSTSWWLAAFRATKEKAQEHPMPFRPNANGSMCQAQRIDLEAARDGKITWTEYFRKWGGGGNLSL